MNLCITANESTIDDEQVEEIIEKPNTKLNKAYLRKLDRKYKNSLFKGKFSTGRLTNTSKSVYSFEGEVLSEEDDEYNTDSSFETTQKIKIDEEDDQMSDNPAEAQPMEIDHFRMRDYKHYDQYS
jgi:vacuolar-type H+-ATPase subunit E/Vma4